MRTEIVDIRDHLVDHHGMPTKYRSVSTEVLEVIHRKDHEAERGGARPMSMTVPHDH